MAFPVPVPGLVIRYSYLWHLDHLAGREEGDKDRPCAIVAAITRKADETRVLVLPVTHTPPGKDVPAVEIPLVTKQRLGLDDATSWIIVSEWNEFVWPGPDLRRIPDKDSSTVAYGVLPPALFFRIREAFAREVRARRAKPVTRTR